MSDTPLLLGHRGALARTPENTMASMRQALLDGAEGFEFDVRVTRDGAAVVLHDETVDRTTDGHGAVASLSRDELEDLDAGSHFSEEFVGERIPDLSEVLFEYLGQVALAMELKVTLPLPTCRALADQLRQNPEAELVIASFDANPLAQAKEFFPSTPRAMVLRPGQDMPPGAIREELELWGTVAPVQDVTPAFAKQCREAGLKLFAYTVNDPAKAAFLAELGIDGIISDDPRVIHPVLA